MVGPLITSIASGQVITKTGHYRVFPIAGTAVMTAGLYLLSTLDLSSTKIGIFLYMFVLGLGLGSVMQVLILIVQNAVDYADLGVATSGAALFRSVGGALGTSVMGAVFSNRLAAELKDLFHGAASTVVPSSASISPKMITGLPTEARDLYLRAFTNSMAA